MCDNIGEHKKGQLHLRQQEQHVKQEYVGTEDASLPLFAPLHLSLTADVELGLKMAQHQQLQIFFRRFKLVSLCMQALKM